MHPTLLNNVNVAALDVLLTPDDIKRRLPMTDTAAATVLTGRDTVQRILDHQDHRVFVVVGPCSIHDLKAAREYAQRLRELANEVGDTLVLIMRVYFEKPRTTVGWKGLINDPHLDDSFNVAEGLQIARALLLEIAEMGLPTGTEALDPLCPQYLDDLLAWTAIGARTTESQTHREMASGLSTPVGFKNATNGNLDVAINALQSAARPHSFLGINQHGQSAVIRTTGNRYGHVVLRGGTEGPNYDTVTIALCEQELIKNKLPLNLVVDCSHANARKDPALQPLVLNDCVHQILEGNRSIVGFMIESNLEWGNQPIPADRSQLKYGVSVTDACVDWTTTAKMLREARAKLKDVLPGRFAS
ncbi:3-deoxy-7-phosphoheptulonate synthase [Candidatus Contendibacter odensensis]|uniref:Phospho-2-dehydro-3-deoxyheptonate aldolase n=1 Tax=Candidatus Contendobacter odensis Run_B_J11 TaxID=1400861 RepID=A0A7U7GEX5_9GAMM|nr:3-deoxy-7-phosphoheptulonate synthase [Candidatus Contendobacter odensis]CDH47014.1 Phospho-2-dehydro-3-deoxyheptonate aldolase, Tyr-sensitive [Candidatus Contendobacter odensis Run_B_J11]